MEGINRIHRHFLVAPLLLTLVVVSVANRSSLEASTLPVSLSNHTESPSIEAIGEGVSAMLYPGAEIDQSDGMIHLTNGTLLVRGEGISEIRVGSYDLTSLAGAFYVSLKDDKPSIAAITAPVLVEDRSKAVLVPVGYQWRGGELLLSLDAGYRVWSEGRELLRLPKTFRREQLKSLSQFPEEDEDTMFSLSGLHETVNSIFAFVRLPQAKERSRQATENAVLNRIENLVLDGDFKRVREMLEAQQNASIVSSKEGQRVLARLITKVSENTPLEVAVLEPILQDERMWLLASVHPDVRKITWGMDRPRVRRESGVLYLTTLPRSDILPDPLPSYVLESWERAVFKHIYDLEDAEEFLDVLVSGLLDLTHSFAYQDYPQRVRTYREVLAHIVKRHGDDINPVLREQVSELDNMERVDGVWGFDEQDVSEAKEEEVTEYEVELTPDQVKAKTYELLRDQNALFTVNTKIEAISPQEAHVSDLLFGDHTTNFILNVVTGNVSEVVHEGKVLPYSMPLGEFAQWVRK